MKKVLLASVAVLAVAGSTAVYAQHRGFDVPGHHRHMRMHPEDRAAFMDARIAAVKAGLKLTPDQEKLWPPVEAAMRDMIKMRQQRREAMRDRPRFADDAPAALRAMADAATARGEALRKLADASQPLYASLDPGQKRRAMMLARPMGGHGRMGGEHREHEHGPGGDDR